MRKKFNFGLSLLGKKYDLTMTLIDFQQ